MKLHLIDWKADLVEAWKKAFAGKKEVTVAHGDILEVAENSIVSPANSYGHMDGGIDEAYFRHFGQEMQDRVYQAIAARPEGLLPVGASLVVRTGDSKVPYLIVAPTMEIPEAVPALHAYRAMRAVLRVAAKRADIIRDIYCPGLATGVGRVPVEEAAEEMARAYRDHLAAGQ